MNRPEHLVEVQLFATLKAAVDLGNKVNRLHCENDFLRALVGNSDKACVYCGLGAGEQGRCGRGFPGCSRADDQMLCREMGAAIERDAFERGLEFVCNLAKECLENGEVRVERLVIALHRIRRRAEELIEE